LETIGTADHSSRPHLIARVYKTRAAGRAGAVESRPSRWWYALLVLPVLGLMYPPLYARHDPELVGFPFFYWYQFAWVLVSAVITLVVYLATRRGSP
jgi:hypothetical protein